MSEPFRFCMNRHEIWRLYMYVVFTESGRKVSPSELKLLAKILEDMRIILEITDGSKKHGEVPPNPAA